MFWVVAVLCVIGCVIKALSDAAEKQMSMTDRMQCFHPEIHYRKVFEEGKKDTVYLRRICSPKAAYAKERLEIIMDFAPEGLSVFFLKNDKDDYFLRTYIICSENPDGIQRYVLHNLNPVIAQKLMGEENSRLNRYCVENLGKPAAESKINQTDSEEMRKNNINCYPESFAGVMVSQEEAARIMETREPDDPVKGAGKAARDPDDDEPEDFDPDTDEVPEECRLDEDGDLVTDVKLPEDPNRWGSEAWWKEQEKFINDSLYVNHDWDIFKEKK